VETSTCFVWRRLPLDIDNAFSVVAEGLIFLTVNRKIVKVSN
jgi:hypothetical protein